MLLDEIIGDSLTRGSEGLTVAGENGDFSIGAVPRIEDMVIVMIADYKWTKLCKRLPECRGPLYYGWL